jgi:L-threonylcarbamoyladenylate synthase
MSMNSQTEIRSIHQPGAIEQGAELITSGRMIAFPTDTVYGIGTSAFNSPAVEQIYRVKNRSQLKAIPILIGEFRDLQQITPPLSPLAESLVDKFWPGPLTLVLPLLPALPTVLSPTPTIGVRLPDHQLVRKLLRRTGPLAATSANISGQPPATTAEEVLDQLAGKINLILDGGKSPAGISSTVLDCTRETPILIREGSLPWRTIADYLKLES